MEPEELKAYKHFRYIVADSRLLDGKLAIRGTRFSVSFLLSCLAGGMSLETIEDLYGPHVRQAVPEALEATDIPSPEALTPAQRVAELNIPGFDELFAWFGFFPSFHDAEVISIALQRAGPSLIAVHAFESTSQVNEKGQYVSRKHVTVTFVVERIEELNLEGFNHQNVLNGIYLSRTADGYELILEGNYGVSGKIRAGAIRIELSPSAPA